ncbi:QueT transporter family protein [Anoxynatronum sibiricum]|uniref:QueT transporter family protein n=1 Tax=Anoxynatronum sibiricum TaxID=210623 RepID=A0ABU9VS31_9CLOT
MKAKTTFWMHAAMIAAIYTALTVLFRPISYGMIQVRVSEALTVLPFLTPAAIPGLAVGCLIANIIGPYGLMDIVVGTAATTLAAFMSAKMRRRWLVPLPPVVVNAVMIGAMLYYLFLGSPDQAPIWTMMLWVGVGQMAACYGLGYPLLLLLEKYRNRIFSGDIDH